MYSSSENKVYIHGILTYMNVLNEEFAYYVRIIFHCTYMLWIYKYFEALFYLQLQVWVNELPYLIYN